MNTTRCNSEKIKGRIGNPRVGKNISVRQFIGETYVFERTYNSPKYSIFISFRVCFFSFSESMKQFEFSSNSSDIKTDYDCGAFPLRRVPHPF